MTRGAPHLVTSRLLEDEHATGVIGTALGVVTQRLDRVDIVLFALMRHIAHQSLAGVALGTEKVVTETTLVPGRDAPTTLDARTGHEEIGTRGFGHFIVRGGIILASDDDAIQSILSIPETLLDLTKLLLKFLDLLLCLILLCFSARRILIVPDMRLGLGQETGLLMFPVLLVHERAAQRGAQVFHVPFGRTEETLGHQDRVLDQIRLDTLVARDLVASRTRDAAVRRLVEFFHANAAFRFIGHGIDLLFIGIVKKKVSLSIIYRMYICIVYTTISKSVLRTVSRDNRLVMIACPFNAHACGWYGGIRRCKEDMGVGAPYMHINHHAE